MFVTAQPFQRGDNYQKLMQDVEPPPPPGNENDWELHFCKWWGWNWIRRQTAEPPIQRTSMSKPSEARKSDNRQPQQNQSEKKPTKGLLCFKKRKDHENLQKMYNTPSNSVIESPHRRAKPVSTTQSPYNTPSNSMTENNNKKGGKELMGNTPSSQMGTEEELQRAVRKQDYATKNVQSAKKKTLRNDWTASSSCESTCVCKGSSTDESVDYINISCCTRCHPKEPLQTKCTNEKCTQGTPLCCKGMCTQTKEKEKKRRRRRIYVVCCSCGQNNPIRCEEKLEKKRSKAVDVRCEPQLKPTNYCRCNINEKAEEKPCKNRDIQTEFRSKPAECCPCDKNGENNKRGEKNICKNNQTKLPAEPMDYCLCGMSQPPSQCRCCGVNANNEDDKMEKSVNTTSGCVSAPGPQISTVTNTGPYYINRCSVPPPANQYSQPKHYPHVNGKYEHLYATGMPMDTLLYYNKPITKFGIPSQNYSWLHSTRSDIWDQISNLKFNHEFSSPISGATYNISPIKIDNISPEMSSLFNPLSVEEELASLKRIESDVKMDLKSRIMLDAVCDAILSKDKELDVGSSVLLNEFTYPSNVTQTECIIKDVYKSEEKRNCPKSSQAVNESNQAGLNELLVEDVLNKSVGNQRVNGETNTTPVSPEFPYYETNSVSDNPKLHMPQIFPVVNQQRTIFDYSSIHPIQQQLRTKENEKLADYIVKNGEPWVTTQKPPSFTRMGLLPAYKRCAPSTPRPFDIKKVKLKDPSTSVNVDNTNISDIFKKIDEIVLRSKVNNEEIQNVLNVIPKRTFQFFTSWEVSNMAHKNPKLQITEQTSSSTSSPGANVTSEETMEKQETKPKTSQLKKKKVSNRPSLIPKRVSSSKQNKKNAS